MTDVQEQVKTDEKPDWHEEIGGLDVEPAKELAQEAPEAALQEAKDLSEDAIESYVDVAADEVKKNLAEQEQERDYEAEAVKMGWKPNGAKSAQEFVEYGEKHKPANYAKVEIDRIKQDYESRFEALQRTNQAVLEHQRQQIEASYNERIRAAAEIGDMAAFDHHTKAKDAELQQIDQIPQAPQPQQAPVEFITWKAEQNWDAWEPGRQAYAVATLDGLIKENPGVDQAALIPALNAKLDQTFGGGQRQAQRQVPRQLNDTGGRTRSKPQAQKGFGALPAEAVKGYKEITDNGIDMSKDEYAKIYYAENSQ